MKKIIIFIILILILLFITSQTAGVFNIKDLKADISSQLDSKVPEKQEIKPDYNIAFAGDMMFDRGVERLTDQLGNTYPIDLIKDFLKGFDYAVGNLEGPINEKPSSFTDGSLKFSFSMKAIDSLKAGNFQIVSLANNHTLNTNSEGLEETRQILKKSNIGYTGDPIECGIEYLYQKDYFSFYAVNETFPMNCDGEDLTSSLIEIKYYNPDSLIVVMMHWGEEYSLVNSEIQEQMAHDLIDAGADVIIGGHPHVTQNIEKYKGKLIFYSLGNFIFDQYFSKETQEGLVIGMELYKDKEVYKLYPVMNKLSQPRLMEGEEKQAFLDDLAGRSSEELSQSIKNGVIEIDKI